MLRCLERLLDSSWICCLLSVGGQIVSDAEMQLTQIRIHQCHFDSFFASIDSPFCQLNMLAVPGQHDLSTLLIDDHGRLNQYTVYCISCCDPADLTTIHVEWFWQNPLLMVTFAAQKGAFLIHTKQKETTSNFCPSWIFPIANFTLV